MEKCVRVVLNTSVQASHRVCAGLHVHFCMFKACCHVHLYVFCITPTHFSLIIMTGPLVCLGICVTDWISQRHAANRSFTPWLQVELLFWFSVFLKFTRVVCQLSFKSFFNGCQRLDSLSVSFYLFVVTSPSLYIFFTFILFSLSLDPSCLSLSFYALNWVCWLYRCAVLKVEDWCTPSSVYTIHAPAFIYVCAWTTI